MADFARPAVIIAGSRTYGSGVSDERAVAYLDDVMADAGIDVATVVSGGARGADSYGEQWAAEHDVPVERYPISDAMWNHYGNRAGWYRNRAMAYVGDALVAIWDGQSTGTRMMIDLADQFFSADAVHVHEYR